MATSLNELNAARSIFDSVAFKTERRRLQRETVFVCSLLGLKPDFLDSLDEMAPIHRNRRTLSNWIVRFLQNNNEFVALTDKTSLTKALLASIGFDPLSTADETILDRHSITEITMRRANGQTFLLRMNSSTTLCSLPRLFSFLSKLIHQVHGLNYRTKVMQGHPTRI